MPEIRFEPDERRVTAASDATLLRVALDAGVALAHACGGHARCSTCRVMVEDGAAHLGDRSADETAMATRLRFPPDVRLACQTRVQGDAVVRRLVVDDEDRALAEGEARTPETASVGEERRVAILFCDVRNFTTFSESHPAYDVIHLLNRWYARVVPVVEAHGGRMDTVMGDGFLAIFDAPLAAVKGALALLAQAALLSTYVEAQYGEPFRVGVGLHWGDAVLGAVGAGAARRLTAIGDSVNLAARVESATKEARVGLLLTKAAWDEVSGHVRGGKVVELALKGKTGTFELHEVVGLVEPAAR